MNIKQYRLNKETLYRELYKWTHWTHGDSTSNKLYKYLSWYNKKYLTEIFDLTLEGVEPWKEMQSYGRYMASCHLINSTVAKWQCLEQTYQHASLNQTMSFSFKLNDIVWKLPITFEINFYLFYFHPPQGHGGERQHDFGLEELDASNRKALSKSISQLIISGNVFD